MWLPFGAVQVAPCGSWLAIQAMCAGSIVSCFAPITSVGTVIRCEIGGAVPVHQLAAGAELARALHRHVDLLVDLREARG